MGATKAAGTAARAVPAVRVAATAAGVARKGSKRAGGADPRVTAPGSKAAAQRQAIEDLKDSRPPEPATVVDEAPAEEEPSRVDARPVAPRAGGFVLPAMPAAATTGSGFALGIVAWAFGLAYLRGGMAEVKRLARAKFFNDTGG